MDETMKRRVCQVLLFAYILPQPFLIIHSTIEGMNGAVKLFGHFDFETVRLVSNSSPINNTVCSYLLQHGLPDQSLYRRTSAVARFHEIFSKFNGDSDFIEWWIFLGVGPVVIRF